GEATSRLRPLHSCRVSAEHGRVKSEPSPSGPGNPRRRGLDADARRHKIKEGADGDPEHPNPLEQATCPQVQRHVGPASLHDYDEVMSTIGKSEVPLTVGAGLDGHRAFT